MKEREDNDEVVGEQIDILKEKNKVALARVIESGMDHKSKLTSTILTYKQAKFEKENHIADIH